MNDDITSPEGESISDNPADYATAGEITRAVAELGDYWRQLGRQLRDANHAALAAWPLHGHRARRRASIHALLLARKKLSEADEALVADAEGLKEHRRLVNAIVDQLTGASGVARMDPWTVDHAEIGMHRDACPTWRTIIARWKDAREQADSSRAEQVRQMPANDLERRRELDRRAQIQIARVRAHLGGGR